MNVVTSAVVRELRRSEFSIVRFIYISMAGSDTKGFRRQKSQHHIHLAEIDEPENAQPFRNRPKLNSIAVIVGGVSENGSQSTLSVR